MRKIKLFTVALLFLSLCACGNTEDGSWNGMEKTGSLELQYAKEFRVDYYEDGYDVITIEGDEYLLVPEGMPVPDEIGSEVTVLQQPLENLYVASSSAMDLFLQAGAIDRVDMTSTSAENWTLPEIREKVISDDILFVGKYSTPDYEVVLDEGCGLAVENTMISHTPEVKEKLEQLGIPVLVERSSYEKSPLGRVEWIKLYGLLTGQLDTAEQFFEKSVQQVQAVEKETQNQGNETPTVAFFYITASGYVNVRTPVDYIAQMIELAGGKYAFSAEELGDQGARSSVNMDPEQFYAAAKDADILIYNSTVEGELSSLNALTEKSPLMKDCKAVLNGTVWCTGQNMFQQVSGTAEMISDLHAVISGDTEQPLRFLHRLS